MDLALRQRNIKRSLTCPICQKLFRQVTTIEECCHRFCHKCIMKKITEEGLHSCPVCNVDLGCAPLQRLRADLRWQSIMNNFNERKREHIEGELLKGKTKISEVSRQEVKGSDVVSSMSFPSQSKERALYPFANTPTPESSLYTHTSLRNKTQEYPADALTSKQYFQKGTMEINREKSLEKMRHLSRPLMGRDIATMCTKLYTMEHVQRQEAKDLVPNIEDVAFTSKLQQSEEFRARRREKEIPIIVPSEGLKNPTTKVVAYVNNIEYNENVKTFWFSLVASNNQKSKAPLEQISSKYLRVKDGNITVSSIKKYLMQKLNLCSENEVEISLQGRLLLPTLQIRKLVDLWLQTTAPSERKRAFVGCSAQDFVLTLTYARRPMSA